jgi:hypothetical protein
MSSESNQPPYHEVDALLKQMSRQNLGAHERRERLQEALKTKIRTIIDVMRMAAHENPELQSIFDAISNNSISSEEVSKQVYDFPVALELVSALEKGLSKSPHSTVRTITVPRFIEEIDQAQINECKAF